jgi:hypothetical protein
VIFKFKYVDDDGDDVGFFASDGFFDGDILDLDGEQFPTIAIRRVDRRFDRLILTVLTDSGHEDYIVISITSGDIAELQTAINATTSRQWANLRRESLAEEGREGDFKARECPHCHAVVDTTYFADTVQHRCTFCEHLINLDGRQRDEDATHSTCDECGYFSQPKGYTIFYFYFLLVIYGWRSQKRFMCSGCMRREAWKMLAGNFLFILGVPVALAQLYRVYTSDKASGIYAGLDDANVLARKGRTDEALAAYDAMAPEASQQSAGIEYNRAMAMLDADDFSGAIPYLEQTLELCSNHGDAFQALCACYELTGQNDALEDLREGWGAPPDEALEEPAAEAVGA